MIEVTDAEQAIQRRASIQQQGSTHDGVEWLPYAPYSAFQRDVFVRALAEGDTWRFNFILQAVREAAHQLDNNDVNTTQAVSYVTGCLRAAWMTLESMK